MSENIRVCVRVRPPNARELEIGYAKAIDARPARSPSACARIAVGHSTTTTTTTNGNAVTTNLERKNESIFAFDDVCDEHTTQDAIFACVAAEIVDAVVDGYHGCVLAYGQTGAGKTYTMQGECGEARDGSDEMCATHAGVIPRALRRLFERIESERRKAKEDGAERAFEVKCSYLEIYNETLRDLLMSSDYDGPSPNIREDNKRGTFVEHLLEERVAGAEQTYETFLRGAANRRVGQTNMNADSSRSHSVFTISVESRTKANPTAPATKKSALLHLVDLAGSERQKSTDAAGERLKEASAINKSLSALGNVIKALVDLADGKERHVPYRDSKLTFLLKDALGGRARCSLLACVSPAHVNIEETLSTLKFAQRAKMVKVRAVMNEETLGNAVELAAEVSRLRSMLAEGGGGSGGDGDATTKAKMFELEATMAKVNRAASAAAKDSEIELEKLKTKLADAKDLCTCLDKNLQSAKMVIRLRDEALKKKAMTPDLLDAEHEELRKQVEHPPEVVRMRMELAALQERTDALLAENERSANRGRLATVEAELKDLRKLVVSEGELTAQAFTEKNEAVMAKAQVEAHNKILEAAVQAAERRAVRSEEAVEKARAALAAAEVLENEHKMHKEAAEADRARIEATFAENKEVMEEMFGKLESLMAYKAQADREKAELEARVAEATAKAMGANSSFHETSAALAAARAQLEQYKFEINAALDVQRAQHMNAISAHANEYEAKLAMMANAHENELAKLKASHEAEMVASAEAQNAAVKGARKIVENEFEAERAAHVDALCKQASTLEANFANKLTETRSQNARAIAALKEESAREMAKICAEMEEARTEMADAHAAKFAAQAEAFAEQIDKINAAHVSAMEALESKHANHLSAVEDRLVSAMEQNNSVATVAIASEEQMAEIASIKAQHAKAIETLESEFEAQIAALEESIENRKNAESALASRIVELKAAHARELEEIREKMQVEAEESLRMKLAEETNKALSDAHTDHEIALEEQKSTLSAAFAADIRHAEKKLALAKEEVSRAKTAAAAEFAAAGNAQAQIRKLQAELEAKDDELKNLERRLMSAARSGSETGSEEDASWEADAHSRADARVESAKAARKRAEERATEMETKVTSLMGDVEDAHKLVAASKAKASAANARIESLEVALHAAKTELAQLKGAEPPAMSMAMTAKTPTRTPSHTPSLKRPAPGATPGKTPGTVGTARRILSSMNAAAASPAAEEDHLKKHMRFEHSPGKSDAVERQKFSRLPELEGIRRGAGRLLSKPAVRVAQPAPVAETPRVD